MLKALALLGLGHRKECLAIVSEVHQNQPTDSSVLRAMRSCYLKFGELDRYCEAYENALLNVQNDKETAEQLAVQLFQAYIRKDDFKKQYTVTMNLYKTF